MFSKLNIMFVEKIFKHKRWMNALLLTFAVFIFALVAALYLSPNASTGNGEHKIEFEVVKGSGISSVARQLEEDEMVRSADFFKLLSRITFKANSLKAGIYELNDGMSAITILHILTSGKVRMIGFTVPEGWHNRQIAAMLVQRGIIKNEDDFLSQTHDPKILTKYRIPASSTEGYLFPETYSIPARYPVEKIHELMLKRFFEELQNANPPTGISSEELHHRVILASIIEREAARKEELPQMAGVFLNRLHKKMRLESCATIQYLLPKPQKKLYERDLQIVSPYNTYKHAGFPPGPISNPGLGALKAAFHPDETPNLFFVLKPDGSHYFSVTYKEHMKAKKEFLDD